MDAKKSALGILCALLIATSSAWSDASKPIRGPSGCPAGLDPAKWICYTVAEEAARQEAEITLEERLNDLRLESIRWKVRARRFGCVAGVGGGVSAFIDDDFDGHDVPAVHLGVTCGWRFP